MAENPAQSQNESCASMNGKYNTAGNIEARYEPGSNDRVLANKLGVSSVAEMDDIELDLLDRLYGDVIGSVAPNQRLTIADIREWHRRWLGNVYAWAGEYRTLNMSKGDFAFAASGQVPRLMAKLDKEILSIHTPCAGKTDDQLCEAIAIVHVELILIHPFREGNGRLSRLLANVMAVQAGWPELDCAPWDERKAEYFAAIQSGMSDYEPMKGLVRRALRQLARNADE